MKARRQPLGSVFPSLIKWSWLIVAAALVAGAVVFLQTRTPVSESPSAVVRVGLNNNAEWPRHVATLDAFKSGVLDQNRIDQVAADLDSGPLEVSSVELDGTFLVEVTVSASSEAAALEAANALALATIDEQGIVTAETRQVELDVLNERFDEITIAVEAARSEMVAFDTELLVIAEQLDVEYDFTLDDQRRIINSERGILDNRIADLEQEQQSIDNQRFDRELELSGPTAELLITSPAEIVVGETSTGSLVVPALAALLAGVLASTIAVWFDRERGVVRSEWQPEELLGLDVLGRVQAGALVDGSTDHRLSDALATAPDNQVIGMWWNDVEDHELIAHRLAAYLDKDYPGFFVENGSCPVIDLTEDEDGHPACLVDLGRYARSVHGLPRRAFHCDAVVLAAHRGITPMDSLRRQLDDLERANLPVLGVVMVE